MSPVNRSSFISFRLYAFNLFLSYCVAGTSQTMLRSGESHRLGLVPNLGRKYFRCFTIKWNASYRFSIDAISQIWEVPFCFLVNGNEFYETLLSACTDVTI